MVALAKGEPLGAYLRRRGLERKERDVPFFRSNEEVKALTQPDPDALEKEAKRIYNTEGVPMAVARRRAKERLGGR